MRGVGARREGEGGGKIFRVLWWRVFGWCVEIGGGVGIGC